MSFVLSKAAKPSKVFLAHLSEMTDRFDPEMVLFRRKIHHFKFPVHKLRNFFSEPPQYGAGERGLERDAVEQPRYIRITDIDEYGILTEELGATAATIEERYFLEEDDLLVARSGNTVGKSYIHKTTHAPYTCFFAGYLIRLRFKRTEVLPDYVFALTQLPYYKEWVRAIQRAAGQPNINAQEYSNFEIPAASLPIQRKVVALLQDAYTAKRRRDDEARTILLSTDDILLNELGIPRKPQPPNTIINRIFRRSFSAVTGNRIDPAANWKKLSLAGGKYALRKLRDVAAINPTTRFPKADAATMVSFVPMDAVSDVFGEITDRQTRPIGDNGSYTTFQEGDVIWAKITPCMENGKSAIAKNLEGGYGYGSTEFHVFRPKTSELSVDFLHKLFRLQTVRQHARLNFTGSSGHQRVDEQFFSRLEIPVPPLKVQESIAAKAEDNKNKAQKLFAEAAAELDKAKREIEAIILGKAVVE